MTVFSVFFFIQFFIYSPSIKLYLFLPHFYTHIFQDGSIVSFHLLPASENVNANGICFSSVLGFPRMGKLRDLKKATEAYWGDKISRDELLAEGKRLRLEHWKLQKDAGVDVIPSNDFAFYDQVLDHIQLFGVCILALMPSNYLIR